MNKKRYYIQLFILIMLTVSLSANGTVKFNNINKQFGLSMRDGMSICKDQNGFIWASHKTGIMRLTNDNYKLYHISGEMKDYLTIKLTYSDSLLIAYTGNGKIYKYNTISDEFEQLYNIRNSLNHKYLNLHSVYISNNYMWLATTAGIYKANETSIEFVKKFEAIPQRITKLNNLQIAFGCEKEIYILNTKSDSIENKIEVSNKEQFKISSLLYRAQEKQLWIGTIADGILLYSFYNNSFIEIKESPQQPILDIEESTDSSIYLGIDGQGVWEINTTNSNIINIFQEDIDNPSSLKGNGVYDIFNDNDRVWITTFSNGISYLEKKPAAVKHILHEINQPNSLYNNNVNSIIEDDNGDLWIGTNNGFCKWEIQNNNWNHFYTNQKTKAKVFLALCEDKNGNIWAGSYASGVYVIDKNSEKEIYHYSTKEKKSNFNTDFVLDIFEDSKQNIWIGGVHGHVAEYLIDENKFNYYSQSPLSKFAEFSDGTILKACAYGLSIIDKKTSKSSIILNGYWVNNVLVENDIVWVCTNGEGILKYNPENENIKKITTEQGLPSNFVNSIIKVDNNLWLGTEHGICKLKLKDESIEAFNNIPDIANLSYNRNASCKLKDGRIACGTNDGIIIFNPNQITQTQNKGKLFVQDIRILGKSVRNIKTLNIKKPCNQIKQLNLKHNQNTISIDIFPINASLGANLTWKIEGLDKNWQLPSNQRLISYSNLPAKNLQLKIRLLNNTQKIVIDEKTINLNIAPPFWETWYFFVIIFILISSVFYIIFWYYINQLKQKHNEDKIYFFTNTAHEIRTSLTLINAPIEELNNDKTMSKANLYYLKLAQKQSGYLLEVVNKLMDFQKVDIGKGQLVLKNTDIVQLVENRIYMFTSLAESQKINIRFKSDKTEIETAIDEQKIEKVIDNLISNAIKYSHSADNIIVEVQGNNKEWILKVIDNGIGISKADQKNLFKAFYRGKNAINNKTIGSGIGLLLVRNYISMHSGDINYQENPEGGSIFTINIPIKTVDSEVQELSNFGNDNSLNETTTTDDTFNTTLTENTPKTQVLVVEDNDDLREFICRALKNDFILLEAGDGEIAWSVIQKNTPDLIISDVMMPNMDGFQLCKKLKGNVQTSHIPLLLLSALTGKAAQLNGLELGADDYLTKPFDMDLLRQKIISIIRNRKVSQSKTLNFIEGNDDAPAANNPLDEKFVTQMLQVVNENIDNEAFNKNNFAEAMNVSSSLLYKKAKAITGQSPSDFIRIVRLKHALELLKTKKYSIAEVSEQCGFQNANYFSTVFKKHFGKTPSEV